VYNGLTGRASLCHSGWIRIFGNPPQRESRRRDWKEAHSRGDRVRKCLSEVGLRAWGNRFATMLKDPVFQFGVFYAFLCQCAFGLGEYRIAKAEC